MMRRPRKRTSHKKRSLRGLPQRRQHERRRDPHQNRRHRRLYRRSRHQPISRDSVLSRTTIFRTDPSETRELPTRILRVRLHQNVALAGIRVGQTTDMAGLTGLATLAHLLDPIHPVALVRAHPSAIRIMAPEGLLEIILEVLQRAGTRVMMLGLPHAGSPCRPLQAHLDRHRMSLGAE